MPQLRFQIGGIDGLNSRLETEVPCTSSGSKLEGSTDLTFDLELKFPWFELQFQTGRIECFSFRFGVEAPVPQLQLQIRGIEAFNFRFGGECPMPQPQLQIGGIERFNFRFGVEAPLAPVPAWS